MICTEEEAKSKHCPIYVATNMIAVSCTTKVFDDELIKLMTKNLYCAGSSCMWWEPLTRKEAEHYEGGAKRGSCGWRKK